MDGFSYHYAGDVRWEVKHKQGTTSVYAPSESVAIQRFMAKYPDKVILKVVKK